MNVHRYDPARTVYLTDDEDILARCAVGVFRPTLRVHVPLGTSYADLTDIERSVLWSVERMLKSGELLDHTGAWIFRGIGTELSYTENLNPNVIGFRVVESGIYEPDYEELVDSNDKVDHGWAKFVHIPAAPTALAA